MQSQHSQDRDSLKAELEKKIRWLYKSVKSQVAGYRYSAQSGKGTEPLRQDMGSGTDGWTDRQVDEWTGGQNSSGPCQAVGNTLSCSLGDNEAFSVPWRTHTGSSDNRSVGPP